MYINKLSLQYPITEQEIRAEMPNTSFPVPFQAPENYAPVFATPQLDYDPVTQMLRTTTPVLTDKGHYEQVWEVVSRFVEYTDAQGVLHTVAEQESEAVAAALVAKGKALQESVVAATQARLDDFAKTRNYDGILSACTYATSAIPKFQTEGQYCVNARDDTWVTCYQLFDDVMNGIKPMPASFADVGPLLPPLEWPN
jgi:hypothetical protein